MGRSQFKYTECVVESKLCVEDIKFKTKAQSFVGRQLQKSVITEAAGILPLVTRPAAYLLRSTQQLTSCEAYGSSLPPAKRTAIHHDAGMMPWWKTCRNVTWLCFLRSTNITCQSNDTPVNQIKQPKYDAGKNRHKWFYLGRTKRWCTCTYITVTMSA